MGFSASDVVPFTQARAKLSELADIEAGHTVAANATIAQRQQRRARASATVKPATASKKRG